MICHSYLTEENVPSLKFGIFNDRSKYKCNTSKSVVDTWSESATVTTMSVLFSSLFCLNLLCTHSIYVILATSTWFYSVFNTLLLQLETNINTAWKLFAVTMFSRYFWRKKSRLSSLAHLDPDTLTNMLCVFTIVTIVTMYPNKFLWTVNFEVLKRYVHRMFQ